MIRSTVMMLAFLLLFGCSDSAKSARYAQTGIEAADRLVLKTREELRKPSPDLAVVDTSLAGVSNLLATASLNLSPVIGSLDSMSFGSTAIPDTVDTATDDIVGFGRRATMQAGRAESEASQLRVARGLLSGAISSAGLSMGPIGTAILSGGGALATLLAAFAAKRGATLSTALDKAIEYGSRVAGASSREDVERVKNDSMAEQSKAGVLHVIRKRLGKRV